MDKKEMSIQWKLWMKKMPNNAIIKRLSAAADFNVMQNGTKRKTVFATGDRRNGIQEENDRNR